MKLYRCLTLTEDEVDEVIEDFTVNGISISEKSSWNLDVIEIKDKISEMLETPDLSIKHTRAKELTKRNVVCFADRDGGEYYARNHNKTNYKTIPILIEIDVDIKDIVIDGRDFLYTCFQKLERKDKLKKDKQIEKMKTAFGDSISKYIDKSLLVEEQQYKIAVCDLATQDENVILSHYNNKLLIEGRNNTIFRSAFLVKTPILKDKIKNIIILDSSRFTKIPELTLSNFLEL